MYKRYILFAILIVLSSLLATGCETKIESKDEEQQVDHREENGISHVVTSAQVASEDREDEGVQPISIGINFQEWIYFGNPDDRYHIYRCKTDGTHLNKVVDAYMEGFHELTEWIYYIDRPDKTAKGPLTRMKWDGSLKEVLIEEDVAMLRRSQQYIVYGFLNNIYRMNLDGSANIKLVSSDEDIIHMEYYEGVIYYSTESGLFSIGEDGTNGYVIKEGRFPSFSVKRNRIYCYGEQIYSISFKGVEEKVILDQEVHEAYLMEDKIFYNVGSELHLTGMKGEESRKLYVDSNLRRFYEKDDWLYFYGNNRIWRTNLQLTEKEIFLGTGEESLTQMFVKLDNRIITKNLDVEEDMIRGGYKLFELMNDGSQKKLSDVNIWLMESKRGKVLYTDAADKKLYEIDVNSNTKEMILDKMIGSFISYRDLIYYTDIQQGYRLYAYNRSNNQHINITNTAVSNMKRTKDTVYFTDNQKHMGILDLQSSLPTYIDVFTTKYDVVGDWIYYKNEDDLGRLYRMHKDGSHREALSDDLVVDVYIDRENIFTYEDDAYDEKGQVYYAVEDGANLLYSIDNDRKQGEFLDIVSKDLVDMAVIDGVLYMHMALANGSYYTKEKYVENLEYQVSYDLKKQKDSRVRYFIYPMNDVSGYLYGYNEQENTMRRVIHDLITDFQIVDHRVYYSGYGATGYDQPFLKMYHMDTQTTENIVATHEDNVLKFQFLIEGDAAYYAYDGQLNFLWKKELSTGNTRLLSRDCVNLLAIADGWVYYENDSDEGHILRARTDKAQTMTLTSGKGRFIYAKEDTLYYLSIMDDADQKGMLMKKNLMTDEEEMILQEISWRNMIQLEDYLYYNNMDLNQYNLITGKTHKIYPNKVDYMILQGDEIHLSIYDGEKYKTIIMPLDL